MPAHTDLASRAPLDTARFILPAEWHALAELFGADIGLLMLDGGQIRLMNAALAGHLGYEPDELAGQPAQALVRSEEPGPDLDMTEGDTLMLRAKSGARLPFRVLERRDDPLPDSRTAILALRPLAAHETDVPAPGARLLAITEQLPDMVLVCDTDAGIRYANKAFGQLAGAHGDALLTVVHHDDRGQVAAALERAAGDDSVPLEMRIRRADGGWSHVAGTAVNLLGHPDVQGLLVNVRDITGEVAQRQRSDSERKRQLHYLNRLLRVARRPQANLDSTLKVILKSAAKALGVQRCAWWEAGENRASRCVLAYDDVHQNYLVEETDALFARAFEPLLHRVLAGGAPLALDDVDRDPRAALYCEYFHAQGIKALLAAPVARDAVPSGLLVFSVVGAARAWRRDETEFAGNVACLVAGALEERVRSHTESRLRDIALEDSLTRLPAGGYVRQRAAEIFPKLSARADTLAVFVIDLDGFTGINDRHGPLLGDELLKAAALRLKNAVRRDDVLVRLEGDAFLLLARDVRDAQVVEDIAQQITDSLRNAFSLQGQILRVSASVGIARYPEHGADLETLLRKAGEARYQAKAAGRGQYRAFSGAAQAARAAPEEDPAAQLRRAIAQHELQHYYQPQVDLGSGRIRGVEALLRWQHPQHGLLLPASFLPLAEQGDDIGALTAWALDDACRQAAVWHGMGMDDFTIALKLSAAQLADTVLLPALEAALSRRGLPARQVECEIKEAVLRDADEALLSRIRGLGELGAAVTIDETGGEGLEALVQRVPVHKVKIDASPAGGMQETDTPAVADAAIAAAHALGLEVVAKGVETSQQVEHLRERGCDIGLGYYYTQPLTADQFEKWLTRR
ncbi:sensor domain-containing protein [Noviherbaspirillum aridicola]|uniref:PAS domain S-box-containing protein/diguanylate cyclase (GGDEF)-like protein n=1 Tax=Noviherbaspirillum aridicola TaxID=2849687 RepID=A0ABQ4Q3S4_9BURK|nr:EAL domain-containing protein [Noviherbaspirillum aridicola]GIZ51394.1 hypothetical protein NCCP691_14080 [Noviherbaspirillum aridicola]